eukprot:gb/GFBE01059616.1/.p1 GENE.gb/GFBE01059616.1/~~gb/GFBE01059616.1/.p1  ORF type:complete len:109 (+),score=18.32 gb/GFBE01059616.1/:1-327(+)
MCRGLGDAASSVHSSAVSVQQLHVGKLEARDNLLDTSAPATPGMTYHAEPEVILPPLELPPSASLGDAEGSESVEAFSRADCAAAPHLSQQAGEGSWAPWFLAKPRQL